MRRLAALFLPALFSLLTLSAGATPITAGTYTLSGVTVGGFALTGSLTLDSSGLATSASFNWANSAYSSPTFSRLDSKGVSGYNPIANFAYIAQGNGQVAFYYLQSLNTSGGLVICEAGTNCAQDSYLQMYSPNYSAKLVGGSGAGSAPVAVTPEPSSPVLLLTGLSLTGLALALHRRTA